MRILEHTGWNRKKAARILKVNTTTVYRKLQKYGIEEPDSAGDQE